MLLMIDNFDSFTYNLVQYFAELAEFPVVFRNNASINEVFLRVPSAVVISPGPCSPDKAGISCAVIKHCAENKIPLLGVCLGHQCIGKVFGGEIIHAPYLMHGKVSEIIHNGKDLFRDIPQKFTATRYHSLIIEKNSLPNSIAVTAKTKDGIIMGIKHLKLPIYGVQFHPESILTSHGKKILWNFLSLVGIRTRPTCPTSLTNQAIKF
jgi:anthranilate synthase/aminodeoxychorismate synthase-like glutamine amidotransferase